MIIQYHFMITYYCNMITYYIVIQYHIMITYYPIMIIHYHIVITYHHITITYHHIIITYYSTRLLITLLQIIFTNEYLSSHAFSILITPVDIFNPWYYIYTFNNQHNHIIISICVIVLCLQSSVKKMLEYSPINTDYVSHQRVLSSKSVPEES